MTWQAGCGFIRRRQALTDVDDVDQLSCKQASERVRPFFPIWVRTYPPLAIRMGGANESLSSGGPAGHLTRAFFARDPLGERKEGEERRVGVWPKKTTIMFQGISLLCFMLRTCRKQRGISRTGKKKQCCNAASMDAVVDRQVSSSPGINCACAIKKMPAEGVARKKPPNVRPVPLASLL